MSKAAEEIKRLVHDAVKNGDKIKAIANRAGVRYQPLQRFIQGINPKYNLVAAEAVFFTLTGKPLIPAVKPSRKGRAA